MSNKKRNKNRKRHSAPQHKKTPHSATPTAPALAPDAVDGTKKSVDEANRGSTEQYLVESTPEETVDESINDPASTSLVNGETNVITPAYIEKLLAESKKETVVEPEHKYMDLTARNETYEVVTDAYGVFDDEHLDELGITVEELTKIHTQPLTETEILVDTSPDVIDALKNLVKSRPQMEPMSETDLLTNFPSTISPEPIQQNENLKLISEIESSDNGFGDDNNQDIFNPHKTLISRTEYDALKDSGLPPHTTMWDIRDSPYNPGYKILVFYNEGKPITHMEINKDTTGELISTLNEEVAYVTESDIDGWYIRVPEDKEFNPYLYFTANNGVVENIELDQEFLKSFVPRINKIYEVTQPKQGKSFFGWMSRHKFLTGVLIIAIAFPFIAQLMNTFYSV